MPNCSQLQDLTWISEWGKGPRSYRPHPGRQKSIFHRNFTVHSAFQQSRILNPKANQAQTLFVSGFSQTGYQFCEGVLRYAMLQHQLSMVQFSS